MTGFEEGTDWVRELIEHTDDILWVYSADWDELLFINRQYESVWGRPVEELYNQPRAFLEGVHPDDRPIVTEAMERLSGGEPIDIEHRVNPDEDFSRWVWVHGTPVRDETGSVTTVLGFARDISERKAREEELRRLKEEYETVFETAQDAIFLFDVGTAGSDHRFTVRRLNPAHESLTGLCTADVKGLTPREILGEEAGADVEANFRRCVEAQAPITYDERLEMPAGTRQWHTTLSPVMSSGAVTQIVGVARDVTARREHEAKLTQLRDLSHELTYTDTREETARLAIDAASNVIEAPLSGSHLVSEDGEALEPVAVAEDVICMFETAPRYERVEADTGTRAGLVWGVYETGESVSIADTQTYEGLREDTPARSVLIHPLGKHGTLIISSPEPNTFDDTDEMLVEILATALTSALDRVEREQALREWGRRLKRQNRRLDEFAGIVSHDLRNPLNVAKGRLELAKETGDDAHLDAVEGAHRRMEGLIEDLLTLARDGGEGGSLESVTIGDIVTQCWETVVTANATLELVTDPERSILADRSRFRQLLENLIRNAIEHGGEAVTVTVGDLDGGFYVEDDGPGISEADRERVFEVGYSTSSTGTGFGLSIVREIAESHGWSVEVRSGQSGGTRFEFGGVRSQA